uniref:Reverse transcriptase zinc-binding domain-containing protein n=1 Tax=Micrurus corallinus TaxID=54390 RepID=A0A2D4GFT4_MICCO
MTLVILFKENLYKLFYRWHIPPSRLAIMYSKLSPTCWKCNKEKGTYYHLWWSCKKAQKYWQKLHKWLEEICGMKIEHRPEFFLLGINMRKYDKENIFNNSYNYCSKIGVRTEMEEINRGGN